MNLGITTNNYTYSAAGDLLTLTDGKIQVTRWNYDQYGRATNKVDATSTEILRYQYDAGNRLTNRWSASKGNTTYRYDAIGNLTNVVYPVSPAITMKYDALNRLTNMVDAVGTTVYGYANQFLANEDGPWANDTVSYGYQNGFRTSLSLIAPNASPWTQSYGYDTANRLNSLISAAGSFSYAFKGAGNLVTNLALPNGSAITNAFDNVGRLAGTYFKNSGGTILNSHAYGYNQAGQRTAVTNLTGNYLNYSYDLIGELKTSTGKESGGSSRLQEQFGYAYDAAGNLNYRTNNALVQTFAANNLNELSTATRSGTLTVAGGTSGAATNVTVNGSAASRYGDNTFALAGFTVTNGNNAYTAIAQDSYGRKDTNSVNCNLPSSVSFVYDSNGNLTSDGSRGFDYDDENQLVRVTVTNSWKSEFTYDGKMRRRIRKEFAWQNSMWVCTGEVRYIYDGKVVIQERDGNNLPAVTYTRGRDLSSSLQGAGGIGGLLARTDQQSTLNNQLSTSYYHADGNGNVTAMVNLQQLVVGRYVYDPFGNILSKSGPLADANTYRFSSQEYHQPSGLSLYLYRAYDPNLQRWLNPDPIQEGGGINLYRFVGNNPINWVDPLGLLDYYYSGGGLLTPSGPVPYLEGETLPGQLGASMYDAVPLAFNFLFGGLLNIGTAEGAASVHGRSTVPTVNALADDALAVASVIPGEGVLPKVACEARTATRIAQAAKVTRAINLPGWKNLTVDMTHIAERHMTGGPFTQGRTIFANLNEQGVMAAIKQAYGSATTVAVQGDRVLLSGTTKAGMIVEMWLNKATKVIETAYPVVP